MRIAKGVFRIPIKILYVLLIVTATSISLLLNISKEQKRPTHTNCRVIPKRFASSVYNESNGPAKKSKHPVCWKDPRVTRYSDCPDCFRPNIKKMAHELHKVNYSIAMFPRGPPDLFKLRREVQQGFITEYLISPTYVCSERCPYLLAIVLSISEDFEQRAAIRATWASVAKTHVWPNAYMNADFQILFVLAHKTPESNIKLNEKKEPKKYVERETFPTVREWAAIKAESDLHEDILYLNMQDSYYNLTLKLMSAFKWVDDHCPGAKFIIKVDTDTFVNLPLLTDLLIYSENRLEYSLLGRLYIHDRTVMRESKWSVDPQIYPPPTFPVYASELAYVISSNVLRRITKVAPFLSLADDIHKLQQPDSEPGTPYLNALLTFVLRFDYYTIGTKTFAHFFESEWFWCDIFHDKKVTGLALEQIELYKLWRGFFKFYGKCWKEIPRLANPGGE